MLKHPVTWFLLADESVARILENTESGDGLHQIEKGAFKALTDTSYSDDEGRVQSSVTRSRLRLDKPVAKSPESLQFARDLIDRLESERKKGSFDRLAISASPGMLGLLRSMLPEDLKSVLMAELNKDLVNVPTNDVAKHFDGAVRL